MLNKKYTEEQLKSVDTFFKNLASIPEEKHDQIIMMANSFLLGVQAHEAITTNSEKSA